MTERNKFLMEALGYEQKESAIDLGLGLGSMFSGVWWVKEECKRSSITDFSSWAGFGELWEWANEQKWWYTFLNNDLMRLHVGDYSEYEYFDTKMINPDKFATAIHKHLVGNGCPEWSKCTDKYCPDCGT